ncbi:hypothetical protein GCM10009835_53180 [Planosporangium flavigriseum]|uniref:Uncharacterized protein n=1 Tax=Planosporangium flavigriseum TaxID=373681 RepID=A0A8J3LTD6_9ACTN|nr:hypothetical protein Pfl04_48940 [Planosporangium flavigriseum]
MLSQDGREWNILVKPTFHLLDDHQIRSIRFTYDRRRRLDLSIWSQRGGPPCPVIVHTTRLRKGLA